MHRIPFLTQILAGLSKLTAHLNHRLTPLLHDDHPWRRKTEAWGNTPLKFAVAIFGGCQFGIILGLFSSAAVLQSFGYLYLLVLAGWLFSFSARWRQHSFSSPLARLLHECFSQPDSYALPAGLLFGGMLFGFGFGPALLCLPLILYPFVEQRLHNCWSTIVPTLRGFRADHDPLLASRLPAKYRLKAAPTGQPHPTHANVTG